MSNMKYVMTIMRFSNKVLGYTEIYKYGNNIEEMRKSCKNYLKKMWEPTDVTSRGMGKRQICIIYKLLGANAKRTKMDTEFDGNFYRPIESYELMDMRSMDEGFKIVKFEMGKKTPKYFNVRRK